MFTNLFGNYLVDKGYLKPSDLKAVKDAEDKLRVKLGFIAVSEKLISQQQADAINEKQSVEDRRFGDIAIEMGLLTRGQVKRLLHLQSSPYVQFTQAVTELGLLSLQQVEDYMLEFQKEHEYTSMDIDAVKSGDIDRIMPILLPEELSWNTAEHIAVAVRTLNRIVCDDIYVRSCEMTDRYEAGPHAMQSMYGDFESTAVIAGSYDGMMAIACGFAKEQFDSLGLEALDSIAEFINIVDGLFVTAISLDMVEVSLLPPDLCEQGSSLSAPSMCVVSMEIAGKAVDLVVSTGSQVRSE